MSPRRDARAKSAAEDRDAPRTPVAAAATLASTVYNARGGAVAILRRGFRIRRGRIHPARVRTRPGCEIRRARVFSQKRQSALDVVQRLGAGRRRRSAKSPAGRLARSIAPPTVVRGRTRSNAKDEGDPSKEDPSTPPSAPPPSAPPPSAPRLFVSGNLGATLAAKSAAARGRRPATTPSSGSYRPGPSSAARSAISTRPLRGLGHAPRHGRDVHPGARRRVARSDRGSGPSAPPRAVEFRQRARFTSLRRGAGDVRASAACVSWSTERSTSAWSTERSTSACHAVDADAEADFFSEDGPFARRGASVATPRPRADSSRGECPPPRARAAPPFARTRPRDRNPRHP